MESNTSKHTAPSLMLMERSIIKKYRKELWGPFIKAIKTYELVEEGDSEKALVAFNELNSLLDKSITSNIHHKNYVARQKSRYAKLLSTLD